MRSSHLVLATAIFGSALCGQTNPVPLVNNPLSPASAAPGSGAFTLTVNGTGFRASSVVNWNGIPRATAFVSQSQLTAAILASDVAAARTASVTVVNPAPGGGVSNVVFFQVTGSSEAVALSETLTYTLPDKLSVTAIVSGDLNGDGKLDLVVTGYNNTAVLLGKGDGTFRPPVALELAGTTIAIGDFNHDGIPDLALGGCCGGSPVYILLGNGDGTFQHPQSYGYNAGSIVVADFDGDGNLDLGIMDEYNVQILLGNGDGTFRTGGSYPTPQYAVTTVVAGDFNGDGRLDLAVAGDLGIDILMGNGDGTFQTPTAIAGAYSTLVTADFNGDGILDIAAFSAYSCSDSTDSVTVLLGKGDGSFNLAGSYPAGQCAQSLVTGDFNGDGKIDLALTVNQTSTLSGNYYYYAGSVGILLGNGDGTFQQVRTTAGQTGISALAAGDFTGHGRLDLAAIPYPPTNTLAISLQTTVSVSPGLLSFAPTVEKTTRSETVTVANLSTAPVDIAQVGLSGPNAAEFALASDTCQGATVPPYGKCTVSVAFTPAATGPQAAFLSVTDNVSVSPQTTAIAGIGTAMNLTPAGLNFGNVKVGAISPQKVITATNTGSSVIDIQGIYVLGPNATEFLQRNTCGTSLKPRAACSVVIQFAPTATGSQKAAVLFNIKGQDLVNPNNVGLSGAGT